MTYQNDCTLPEELLEQIAADGMEALPELIRILVNEAMKLERQAHLGVGPYERSPERQGYANGYKPKGVETRVGEIEFAIPQVREGNFYPSAFEKGLRSERALRLALAEMYVQGVSTRRVAAITEQLCGTSVSSSQVSRAAQALDGGALKDVAPTMLYLLDIQPPAEMTGHALLKLSGSSSPGS